MEREEIKEIARETVRETLLSLGVATNEDEDVLAIQDDMRWLRKQRKTTEDISIWVKYGMISTVIGGFLYVLWEGFKLSIKS